MFAKHLESPLGAEGYAVYLKRDDNSHRKLCCIMLLSNLYSYFSPVRLFLFLLFAAITLKNETKPLLQSVVITDAIRLFCASLSFP